MPALRLHSGLRPALALALLVPAALAVRGADTPPAPGSEAESFLQVLEASGPDAPVDRKRLSRLFFSIAATLEGGRSAVRLLQSVPNARLLSTESARGLTAARYGAYGEAVERFRSAAARLLDSPEEGAPLYRALAAGHRACWRLDEYTRLMQDYGARAPDMISILSSTEACAQFRRAAFQDSVEGLLARDLVGTDALREELRDVTVELEELERLLEDLRRIDASD